MNKTIFQFFHWYYPNDNSLWRKAKEQANFLAKLGITDVWLPPAYKSAHGMNEPGYAAYDLFDLGEFDQKGSIPTKYGTKQEYLAAIQALKRKGMGVIADVVFNHKIGGDEQEDVPVHRVKDENREEKIGDEHLVKAYTRFTFPARDGKYSTYQWDWHSFSGICEDGTIAVVLNEYGHGTWEEMLDDEMGNFDYLMGSDIEFRNPNVRLELEHWGRWYVETTGITGFRLDALKHITAEFFPAWLDHLSQHFAREFYCIGEFWKQDVGILERYIDATGSRIKLFDVPLHYNFYKASFAGKEYDMRTIFDDTLLQRRPEMAITFVDNHDTQPLQSLESTVDWWFKPIAYAILLLREQGTPCIFYPAVFGARYMDQKDGNDIEVELVPIHGLKRMLRVRKELAYGPQWEYWDDASVVGWTKEGEDDKPLSGYAVLLTNGDGGQKRMSMGKKNAGRTLMDICGKRRERVVLDENGEGLFKVNGGSVSVWVDHLFRV